ncbi:MAG TPA: glycosyltransferase family 2 protein [Bacteroides mediterraneensis]|uniref:glycosyltransferase family A protein n=1 Tax=Bacteroides mediterraneensis TaxID=1841856 RepID=UPI00261FA89A|nr:glycosyltransferase family A protein [Bacteroides mediterraneensis]HJH63696.1 glycosyltransferase family 2 protein [Bacteroides mediterraneensis]
METDSISVIIPVYNAACSIGPCIESILPQSYLHEIILVNDGSTDHSEKVCLSYQVKYKDKIRYVCTKNHGPSHARNKGLDMASGEFVMFVDADDTVSPGCFGYAMEGQKKLDADICFWGMTKHFPGSGSVSYIPKEDQAEGNEACQKVMLALKLNKERYFYFGFTWNKLFKKNIIDKYGLTFREDISVAEDELFTAEYCRHIRSIKVLPQALYNYQIAADSLTMKRKPQDEYITVSETLMQLSDTYIYPPLTAFDRIRAYSFALRGYLENGAVALFTNRQLRHILLHVRAEDVPTAYFQYKPNLTRSALSIRHAAVRALYLLFIHLFKHIK